jgi:HPt (histidine-containing phosphotransfer) domain-containing protein
MDTLCRMGGEEFLIILPSHTQEEARSCAERCRVAVETRKFPINGMELNITISIGIATRLPVMQEFVDLFKAADQALYAAKQSGRNRVCCAAPIPDTDAQEAVLINLQPDAIASLEVPVDLDAVLARCDGDMQFVAEAIDNFCAHAFEEVNGIALGLKDQNKEKLSRSAHSLKSMAGFIAAQQIAELARQIEKLGHDGLLAEVAPALEQLREETQHVTQWLTEYRKTPIPSK